jgi:O-phosphoseryl-tRNA(Cys) synthetase
MSVIILSDEQDVYKSFGPEAMVVVGSVFYQCEHAAYA